MDDPTQYSSVPIGIIFCVGGALWIWHERTQDWEYVPPPGQSLSAGEHHG